MQYSEKKEFIQKPTVSTIILRFLCHFPSTQQRITHLSAAAHAVCPAKLTEKITGWLGAMTAALQRLSIGRSYDGEIHLAGREYRHQPFLPTRKSETMHTTESLK